MLETSTKTEPATAPHEDCAASRLFPLPLSTTEAFFIHQSNVTSTPFVFRVRMRFDEQFDPDCARQAFEIATGRHPLLSAVVFRDHGVLSWKPAPIPPTLRFAASPAETIDEIDLFNEAGLRAVISPCDSSQPGSPRTIVDIDFHHACSDGQGTRAWLADWFIAYTSLHREEPIDLKPLHREKLLERGKLDTPPWAKPIESAEANRNLWTTIRGRTARPPIVSRNADSAEILNDIVFSTEETLAVRKALATREQRLNDVALAMTFVTLNDYVRGPAGRFISVLNPVDIRLPSDLRMPATNRLGLSYLRRRRKQCRSVESLIPDIAEQTRYIKDQYVGAEFIKGLEIVRDRPRLEKFFRTLGWFVPTALFTCLGDTTRGNRVMRHRGESGLIEFGNVTLQSISGFAPLGPGVPLAACACETLDRLTFTVRTNSRWFDHSVSSEITAKFRNHFLHYAGLPVEQV